MRLSEMQARTDLTDRECSKIIGGLIGVLCTMATPETVRNAVKWWADNGAAWGSIHQYIEKLQAEQRKQ
jgi:hypothetical protein